VKYESVSDSSFTIVLTTVNPPSRAFRALAAGAARRHCPLIVAGDEATPDDYASEACQFLSLSAQRAMGSRFARLCPTRVYARKNTAYLFAARQGAEVIVETDDDNFPQDAFWSSRSRRVEAALSEGGAWVNVYRYFTQEFVWPRGFDLTSLHQPQTAYADLPLRAVDCPIQNGLADGDADVDAVYRLVLGTDPLSFDAERRIALGKSSWCPFNSQNTTTWKDAFLLLYRPSYCSWRMTDIWRSFVAQRILWENGGCVLFHGPSVRQERNEHDLLKDFREETTGYHWNGLICRQLEALPLLPGAQRIPENLIKCYECLVGLGHVDPQELPLLKTWIQDMQEAMDT